VKGLAAFAILAALSSAASAANVTSVRRTVVVSVPVSGRVTSIGGDVVVRAPVSGDIVVWGGDVRLEAGAAVGGDVVDFGGTVEGIAASVRGRILTPGSLSAIYLSESRRAPWQASGIAWATVAGLRLFVLALWTLAASLLLRFWSPAVSRAAVAFEEAPGVAAASGIVGVVFLFLSAVAALTALPGAVRVPAAALIVGAAFALKIFGMTALFVFVGQRLTGWNRAASRPATLALGLLVCGAVSLVPVAGPLVWSAASVLAIGASVATRFGSPRFRVAVPWAPAP
jgi:hypothetical protein